MKNIARQKPHRNSLAEEIFFRLDVFKYIPPGLINWNVTIFSSSSYIGFYKIKRLIPNQYIALFLELIRIYMKRIIP